MKYLRTRINGTSNILLLIKNNEKERFGAFSILPFYLNRRLD